MNKLYPLLLLCFLFSCDDRIDMSSIENTDWLQKYAMPDKVEYRSSMEIKDTLEAETLGKLLFHMPSGVARTACQDCHSADHSFYAPIADHFGGSARYNNLYNKSIERFYTGTVYERPIDMQPNKKSPTSANLWKRKDKILSKGIGGGIPGEVQFGKAFDAHFVADLVIEASWDMHLGDLAQAAFDTTMTKEVVACAISIYQQGIISNQSNINLYLKGYSKGLYSYEGAKLYDTHCYDCHNSQDMAASIMSELDSVLVPNLEQVKDSPCFFDACIDTTLYKAIKMHNLKLEQKQINDIKRFIEKDLHDSNMIRYAL